MVVTFTFQARHYARLHGFVSSCVGVMCEPVDHTSASGRFEWLWRCCGPVYVREHESTPLPRIVLLCSLFSGDETGQDRNLSSGIVARASYPDAAITGSKILYLSRAQLLWSLGHRAWQPSFPLSESRHATWKKSNQSCDLVLIAGTDGDSEVSTGEFAWFISSLVNPWVTRCFGWCWVTHRRAES